MSRPTGQKTRISPAKLGVGTLVWLYAALLALPIYFIVVSSSKTNSEIFNQGLSFPEQWSLSKYVEAWNGVSMYQALLNSLFVTVIALAITVALAVPAAYAIARSKSRLGTLIRSYFSLGFLIPGFAALVPTVILAIWIGMFQTKVFLALFLPATSLPLAVVLLSQYMMSIPADLEESATLDGANRFQVLMHVYLPMSMPGLVSVMVLNFITFWNEYIFALILTGPNVEERTVQVALPMLKGANMIDYGLLSAGAVISVVPVFIAYALLQSRLEGAMAAGAVKG